MPKPLFGFESLNWEGKPCQFHLSRSERGGITACTDEDAGFTTYHWFKVLTYQEEVNTHACQGHPHQQMKMHMQTRLLGGYIRTDTNEFTLRLFEAGMILEEPTEQRLNIVQNR
ncbi:hypothetical protein ScPMuIL_017340 [Solemya velum]